MKECIGDYYIEDGILRQNSFYKDYSVPDGKTLYEVLRIIDSVPLFLEDHFTRLSDSAELNGLELNTPFELIKEQIVELCRANNKVNGNIKIIFNYHCAGINSRIFFIEAKYPTSKMYDSGVDTILHYAERDNPTAKVLNNNLRSAVNEILLQKNAFEALLVNRDDCITEGSRSNIFFIINKKVITAGDEHVLGGITRKYIKQICFESGVEMIYRCMPVNELSRVDSIFLTGTSPHLLPIRSIDTRSYSVKDSLLKRLYYSYYSIVTSYIGDHR